METFFLEDGISRVRDVWNKEKSFSSRRASSFATNCIPRRATCTFFTALLRADYAEFIVTKADTMQLRALNSVYIYI